MLAVEVCLQLDDVRVHDVPPDGVRYLLTDKKFGAILLEYMRVRLKGVVVVVGHAVGNLLQRSGFQFVPCIGEIVACQQYIIEQQRVAL